MITHCPNCDTHFRVTADQLKAAAGKVRCSHCHEVFDALANLRDMPRDPQPDAHDVPEERANTANTNSSADIEQAPPTTTEAAPHSPVEDAELYVPEALADDMAAFERSRRSPIKTLLWLIVILGLLAGLAAQGAYFMHDKLAHNVALKPWLDRFCEMAACDVATPRDMNKVVVTQRDVRRHPDYDNVLLINLTVENQAAFDQPYPALRVNFTDVGGNPVARRYFLPFEYLNLSLGDSELMPVATPVLVRLEVVDPGPQAISYQFEFF